MLEVEVFQDIIVATNISLSSVPPEPTITVGGRSTSLSPGLPRDPGRLDESDLLLTVNLKVSGGGPGIKVDG